MKKRITAILLAMCLVMWTLPASALDVEEDGGAPVQGTKENPWNVSASGEGNNVTAYVEQNNEDDENPTYTLTVTGTGKMNGYGLSGGNTTAPWAEYQNTVTRIVIEENVTSISSNCFYCFAVEEAFLPSTLTEIPSGAFCGSRLKSIEIPSGVKKIGDYALQSTNLTEVVIPDTVEKLGVNAFFNCQKLTEVTIGSGVKTIGQSAFESCKSLKELTIPGTVETIPMYIVKNSGVETVILQSGTKKLGQGAFASAPNLKNVVLSDTITDKGMYTFMASPIESIDIPKGVSVLGDGLFQNCTKLKSVVIPNSVTKISGAFSNCNSLESLTIPESVTNCQSLSASWGTLSGLQSITIKEGASGISENAFAQAVNLEYVTIVDSENRAIDVDMNDYDNTKLTIADYTDNYEGNTCTITYSDGMNGELFDTYVLNCVIGQTTPNVKVPKLVNFVFQGWKSGIDDQIYETVENAVQGENDYTATWIRCSHEYNDVCDATCNLCGYVRTAPHDFEEEITVYPTYTSAGEKICTCKICGYSETVVIPKKRRPASSEPVLQPEEIPGTGTAVGADTAAAAAETNKAASDAAESDKTLEVVNRQGTAVSGKDFTEPAVLTIPVDTKNVDDVNNLTIAKFNPETGKLEIVGGSYDAEEKAVKGYITEEGDYYAVEKDNLTTITLQIGSNEAVVNNAKKELDSAPIISQDRTMVPVRFIAEAFGAKVDWDGSTRTVTIELEGNVMTMVIGQRLEGFDAAPVISNDRTMVPIRYISEKFGANVIWVPSTYTVSVAK
ncbi:MAG: leucine-rich repeat protein [Bacillota bacterium]|nr:leucine-rich repeat protein [Bacillota bacterium]